jgi:hypothetical protein
MRRRLLNCSKLLNCWTAGLLENPELLEQLERRMRACPSAALRAGLRAR